MLTILINAYACSPHMGSEPGMAWNWCVNLAKYCELHIITEGEFKDKIEEELPHLPQRGNMHFYYNPVSEEVRRMCWNQGDWRFYYHYNKWQKKTQTIAEQIISETRIDVMHQLNMIGFREPGYLWKIKDKPLIWGPIGGIGSLPFSYLKGGGLKLALFFLVKNLLTKIQLTCSPQVRAMARGAKEVVAATQEAQSAMEKVYHRKVVHMNETGCYLNETHVQGEEKQDARFDVLWVGRFIYTKQLALALRTIAKVKDLKGLHLHVVGKGFTEKDEVGMKVLAEELGVDSICTFHGQIPNVEVHQLMRTSHLFFFTSIFEGTPHVVLEAIGNNLPVLCFDVCGQGDAVNDQVGMKIPLSNPQQSVKDFAEKISYLYNNKDILKELSRNCKQRQKELSWDNKAKQMVELYQKAMNNEVNQL